MYLISKLIMNSLYGRFGMTYKLDTHIITNIEDVDSYLSNPDYKVGLPLELSEGVVLLSYSDTTKYKDIEFDEKHEFNTSIAIAAAITAYARIHMSQFKNSPLYTLFYSDTDSIYINKPLDPIYVSDTELGKMNLENVFVDSIFLAPKVYAGKLEDGSELIKIKGL